MEFYYLVMGFTCDVWIMDLDEILDQDQCFDDQIIVKQVFEIFTDDGNEGQMVVATRFTCNLYVKVFALEITAAYVT